MRRRRGVWIGSTWPDQEDPQKTAFLDDDLNALQEALLPYSLVLDSAARERVLIFSRELIAWNDRLNLLSRADSPNVIRKHVAASMAVFLVARPVLGEAWIDVGTGAGFPGLVLKILRPDMNMTLLDSARKRCLFLENVLRMLELGRVPVLPLRVETLVARGEGLQAFSVLTARAVSSLGDTVQGFGPLVAPNGRIITFKGPQWREELEGTRAAGILEANGFELESATRIPWTAGHLLSLRKTA